MSREEELLKYYEIPEDRPPFSAAPYIPMSPEERKRRVAELNKQVAENIERLQNSAEFRNYLLAMSRFHRYSWGNQMLIWIQKPNATRIAGYNTWKDMGRYVKKGETGIAILAPLGPTSVTTWHRLDTVYRIMRAGKGWAIYNDLDEVVESGYPSYAAAARRLKEMGFTEERHVLDVTNFKVVHVFDISQTEGKTLPEFDVPVLTGAPNKWLFDSLLKLAVKQKVTVDFTSKPGQDPETKGYYRPPDFIWIRPEEEPAQQLNALLHELSHHFTESVLRIPRRDAETIAECAACVVGAHHGFDTGARSFPYVAMWAQEPKRLHENMEAIQKVAERIINEVEPMQPELISAASQPPTTEVQPGETRQQAARRLESTLSLTAAKDMARQKGLSDAGTKSTIIKRILAL